MKFHPILWLTLALLSHAAAQTTAINPILYNVRDFGAVGDGKNLDSPAIDKAIDAAAKAGGGTVLVPAGNYLCGSIHLQSHIELRLGAGSVIVGAPQAMKAYDETEPWTEIAHEDGGHVYFHNSLIWGENLIDVAITGQGKVDGGGLVQSDELLDKMCGFTIWNKANAALPKMGPVRLGNKAIALKLCRGVLIRDVTIFHGGHFAILVTGCDNLTVDNVTMDTNRDGIDIDCCRNTMVSNCRINSPHDDALCPKSTYALLRPALTENLTITNCQVSAFAEGTLIDGTMKVGKGRNGRIKFGTESSGGFRNCTVSNCTFRDCLGLALEEVDGGIMENITITNIAMMNVAGYAIYITTGSRNRTPGATTPSRMKNVYISNVMATGVSRAGGIYIAGLADQPVENIRLDGIRLVCTGGGTAQDAARVVPDLGTGYPDPWKIGQLSSYGLFVRHARALEVDNLSISLEKEDQRPPIDCADVDGLDIFNFKAPMGKGVAASRFEGVQHLTIGRSPVLDGVVK